MTTLWRGLRCKSCNTQQISVVVAHWGFDKDGTLYINGVCKNCFKQSIMTHTRDEQEADTRQAFNNWKEEGGEEADDFTQWEWELTEGEDNAS